jgi:hypothetical protein
LEFVELLLFGRLGAFLTLLMQFLMLSFVEALAAGSFAHGEVRFREVKSMGVHGATGCEAAVFAWVLFVAMFALTSSSVVS